MIQHNNTCEDKANKKAVIFECLISWWCNAKTWLTYCESLISTSSTGDGRDAMDSYKTDGSWPHQKQAVEVSFSPTSDKWSGNIREDQRGYVPFPPSPLSKSGNAVKNVRRSHFVINEVHFPLDWEAFNRVYINWKHEWKVSFCIDYLTERQRSVLTQIIRTRILFRKEKPNKIGAANVNSPPPFARCINDLLFF